MRLWTIDITQASLYNRQLAAKFIKDLNSAKKALLDKNHKHHNLPQLERFKNMGEDKAINYFNAYKYYPVLSLLAKKEQTYLKMAQLDKNMLDEVTTEQLVSINVSAGQVIHELTLYSSLLMKYNTPKKAEKIRLALEHRTYEYLVGLYKVNPLFDIIILDYNLEPWETNTVNEIAIPQHTESDIEF